MRIGWVCGLLLVGATLTFGGLSATPVQAGFDVTVEDAVDVPTRTVSLEGTDYEVSAIARRAPGESVTVSVTAPAGEPYDLYLYDAARRIQATSRQRGSADVTFQTDGLDPGTYVAAVYKQGEFHDVFPIVVAGYDVTVSAPTEPVSDRTVSIPVDITARDGRERPETVAIVLGDENRTVRATATAADGSGYVANVSVASLPPGAYRVYAVVTERRPDEQDQLLGLSDGHTVTVAETPAPENQTATTTAGRQDVTPTTSADVLTPADGVTTTSETGDSTAVAGLLLGLVWCGLLARVARHRR